MIHRRQPVSLLLSGWLAAACTDSSGPDDKGVGTGDSTEDLSEETTNDSSETSDTTDLPCTLPLQIDVEAMAFATLSGEADWSISLDNATWADLDSDGHTDLVLHWYADDDPTDPTGFDTLLGTRTRHVGWFQGPFTGDQLPELLIEGHPDPFRGPDGRVTVADLDGDGYVDLLVPYEEYNGPVPDEHIPGSEEDLPEEVQPEKRSGAWFSGPFGSAPQSFAAFVEAAGRAAVVDDFDGDGTLDTFVHGAISDPTWFWFEKLTYAPTAEHATHRYDMSQFENFWSDRPQRGLSGSIELVQPWGHPLQEVLAFKLIDTPDLTEDQTWLTTELTGPDDQPALHTRVGDVDQDGLVDHWFGVVGVEKSVTLTAGGAAKFAPISPKGPEPFRVGDFNGDGIHDLALFASNGNYTPANGRYNYWLIPGPIEAREYTLDDVIAYAQGLELVPIGDIDGDGFADLAFDQPGWPVGVYPDNARQPGRIWLVSGADLTATINACQ